MREINDLLRGFVRFQAHHLGTGDLRFEALVQHGQHPCTMVIACCDSRCDPALLTDCSPGDLFVVRNVANLVPPCEPNGRGLHGVSAAVEFAVRQLEVTHIIVLGHAQCGGIRALMQGTRDIGADFLADWVNIARPAREKVLTTLPDETFDMQAAACEQAAILVSLGNLLTFPWIRERVANNRLELHGWYFDMAKGELAGYDPNKACFTTLVSHQSNMPKARGENTERRSQPGVSH